MSAHNKIKVHYYVTAKFSKNSQQYGNTPATIKIHDNGSH